MLGQHNLEAIVAFIEKNTRTPTLGADASARQNADPFTGGGAYVPGAGTAPSSAAAPRPSNGFNPSDSFDPFTGAGRSGSAAGAGSVQPSAAAPAATAASKTSHFPNSAVATFDKDSTAGMYKKLAEFNTHADVEAAGLQLAELELSLLDGIMSTLRESKGKFRDVPLSPAQYAVIDKLLAWPAAQRFPAYDLVRFALLHRPCAEYYGGGKRSAGNVIVELVKGCGTFDAASCGNLHMLALRAAANALLWPASRPLVVGADAVALVEAAAGASASSKVNVRLAFATFVLNVAACVRGSIEVASETEQALSAQLVAAAVSALNQETSTHGADVEVCYRLLVALGTLGTRYPALKASVTGSLRVDALVGLQGSGSPKVAACARQLSQL